MTPFENDPEKTITLYGSGWCPYCLAAKNILKSKGLTWSEIRVDQDIEKRGEMIRRSGRTSVPQIFIGERYVGGFEDLQVLIRDGGL